MKQNRALLLSSDTLLERESLGANVARYIRSKIQGGFWTKTLPGENELCRQIEVSRQTLRSALAILKDEGVLIIRKGYRTEIVETGEVAPRPKAQTVRLLTPINVGNFGLFMTEWVDELRTILSLRGISLALNSASWLYQRHSTKLLRDYIQSYPTDLWVLQVSTFEMQKWFADEGIPAVLAGTPYPGVYLPFVDINTRATARHAAGLLIAAGHRDLAIISSSAHFAGDYAALQGVHEAVAASSKGLVRVHPLEYSTEPGNLHSRLSSFLRNHPTPVGLIICQHYVTCGVFASLNQLQKRVPQDVAIISLQTEMFVDYVTPALNHYVSSSKTFARKLVRLIERRLERASQPPEFHWVMPKYIEGKSIASVTMPPS